MKEVQRANMAATNPVRDILSASLTKVVMEKKVKLVLSSLIPRITDIDGLDITKRKVEYTREYFDGKSQITNQRPNTVPTSVVSSKPYSANIFWNSFGIRISKEDRDLFAKGVTKFENKSLAAMRIMAEGENRVLRNGVSELGGKDFFSLDGINVVSSSAWKSLTGEQILEEIRKGRAAHVTGMLFESDELWLDDSLYELLQKPYSATNPKTVMTLLEERNWFEKVVAIPEFGGAVIVENNQANFGYVETMPIQMTDEYQEGRDDVYFLEQHLSELIVLQPKSITKFESVI